jgi:iron complex transport system substrate-binding protein
MNTTKKIVFTLIAVIMLLGASSCAAQEQETKDAAITITDAYGEEITLDGPAQAIISTYSAITENLFALGAGDQVIGIGTAEAYPPEALELPSYSYSKDDVEKFIAANPDVIFFREAVATKYEDLVSELEGAGIKVIALQNTDFDNYVTTIAKVVGKEDTAQDMLEDFHAQMDALKARADKIPEEERVGVFFESRAKEYNTASQSSIAYNGLELINVVNVAKENMEKDTTSSIADFGEEYLLAEADNIDVYIAQLGVMNKEVSIESIKSRPGFDVIKAIKDDRIFIVDEKLISSLTFRQIEGLTQVFEYVYPEY